MKSIIRNGGDINAPKFSIEDASALAKVFNKAGIEYLFIGKGGAALLGYPAMTLDVDIYTGKNPKNSQKLVKALKEMGFKIGKVEEEALIKHHDFVQLSEGPFLLDIIHAPSGLEDFDKIYERKIQEGIYPVANLRDIIASKKAANRAKDLMDIEMLEAFRQEWELTQSRVKKLKSSVEITASPKTRKGRSR